MLRDWLLGKILLGAAVLSILFDIGSFLWSQNEEREMQKQFTETKKNIQQMEEDSKAQPIDAVQQSAVKTDVPMETLSVGDNTTDTVPESENTASLEETDIGEVSGNVSVFEEIPIADTIFKNSQSYTSYVNEKEYPPQRYSCVHW